MIDDEFWARCEAETERVCARAYASVVSWEWASVDADWEERMPLYSECWGRKPVSRSRPAPSGRAETRYGRDALGQVVVADDPSVQGSAVVCWGTVAGRVVQVLRHEGGPLERLRLQEFDDLDRLAAVTTRFRDGRQKRHEYQYAADGLVRSIEESGPGQYHARFEATRSDDGAVTRVDLERVGELTGERESLVIYRSASSPEVRASKKVLVAELPRQIEAWARASGVLGDAYALAIAVDVDSQGLLPPSVGLGTRTDLERWKAGGAPLAAHVWNPAEFAHFDVQLSERLPTTVAQACELVSTDLTNRRDVSSAFKLLGQVADAIREQEWSAGIVIYVVDLELERLDLALKQATTSEDRRAVESGALLP